MAMEIDANGSVLMKKYELGRLLGQGTFAKVYYAKNLETAQSVAIKVIDKEKVLKAGLMEQIKREISVMRLVRHPNVVQLYEVMATKSKIYFVMEYVKGGELFNKVAKGRLKEEAARKYFRQLINAVDFCHSRDVYHRDLKPENLLLDECGSLKISDFGLSALAESKRQDGLLHTTCGTPAYVAPEVISRNGYDGAKADIWSCGVILYVLLAGFLPFRDPNLMEMYRKIGKAEYKCPDWFPREVRKLLNRILDPNPSTRMPMEKIKDNAWFRRGFDDNRHTYSEIVPADEKADFCGRIRNLNAFDIISLSSGFDLSGLFEQGGHRSGVCFTSRQPASTVISKLEETARSLSLKVTKKDDNGQLKMEGIKGGRRNAVVAVDVQIFAIGPSFYLVEMKKTGGCSLEYQKLWTEEMRPALKDIIWEGQGQNLEVDQEEHQLQQQLQQL